MDGFEKWLEVIDDKLMDEIRSFDDLREWYDFYHSDAKPMNPREFLHYWSSLTVEEELFHKLFTPADILRGK